MKLGFQYTAKEHEIKSSGLTGNQIKEAAKGIIAKKIAHHIMQCTEIEERDTPEGKEFRIEFIFMPMPQFEHIQALLRVVNFGAPNVSHILDQINNEMVNR